MSQCLTDLRPVPRLTAHQEASWARCRAARLKAAKPRGAVSIRIRGGTRRPMIKVATDRGHKNWIELDRLVWERAHGRIPGGFIVDHLNGDAKDCRLENLRLLIRREAFAAHLASMAPGAMKAVRRSVGLRATTRWLKDARAARRLNLVRRRRLGLPLLGDRRLDGHPATARAAGVTSTEDEFPAGEALA